MNHETIELVCIAIIAAAVAIQTIVMLAMFLGISKAALALRREVKDLRTSIAPKLDRVQAFADKAEALVDRLSPKVEASVTDLAAFSSSLRTQAADLQLALGQILERVGKQTVRVDDMFTDTLDTVDKAAGFVTHAVAKPVRQLSGLLAGFKAIIESLRLSRDSFREPEVRDDKDLFV